MRTDPGKMSVEAEETVKAEPVFEKKVGLDHLFAAARYSSQGFRRLLGEAAFRHELIAFAAGLVVFALVGATFLQFIGFVVLMAILFAVEALNTAIEELVDRISPEISTVGRNAKDLGSFAVFCMLVSNGLFALYVVIGGLFF
ncbi:diacylglycerol kinase (ATP) [Rhizobium halophytocola]|uniref:Diacylglycerol kinase n=2 Tax=Rhizobium halophytocola TaxID=735519 RepID=A0ABS4DZ18_9HYPH|nr:diacylglycerol kinase (ATP) [Rhizobium halophytocola]